MTLSSDLIKAKKILDEGGVVGFPTETVYGLGARIDLPDAIEKIFHIKERPFFDPLIVHASSIHQAKTLSSSWGPVAQILAEAFWPGPFTLVLPKSEQVSDVITSGLESVGIRVPNHPIALRLIEEVGVPLAAPSANKFGRTSPTKAEHVDEEFKNENVFVLEGGDCQIGIESTVLKLDEEPNGAATLALLRPGHILRSDIERVLAKNQKKFVFLEEVNKKFSPGHMKHHYMPSIPFVIITQGDQELSSVLGQVNRRLLQMPDEIESVKIIKPAGGLVNPFKLQLSSDAELAARQFYGSLRRAAQSGSDCILFFRETSHQGERWDSLFDRMNKAASLII